MCCSVYIFTMHCASCEWWDVCGTYAYVPKHPVQAHITHCTLLCYPYVGSVQCARRPAKHPRCNACVLARLYMYSPVCD